MEGNEYLQQLVQQFRNHENKEDAEKMKAYMRNKFDFLGIKTPQRNKLLKAFIAEHGKPDIAEAEHLIRELWKLPEREFQNIAIGLIELFKKELTSKHLELLEELLVTKSWWDTVDYIAINPIGMLLKGNSELIAKYINKWSSSTNIWLNRTAILYQLKYKEDTDEKLLYDLVKRMANSDEFFIQKAIGWALREYSKTNPQSVITFIENNKLASLSKREGLKVVKKQALI